MASVQTYDIDVTYLQTHYPQDVVVDAAGPLTTARLTRIIEDAASEVNGELRSAGFDPDEINTDATTSPDAYSNVRRMVAYAAKPRILEVNQTLSAASELVDLAEQKWLARLDRFRANPGSLGSEDVTAFSPQVRTSADGLGVDTSADTRATYYTYSSGRSTSDVFPW